LALPFYLIKRQELPEPKKGQKEWNLFTEMYGKEWNTYAGVKFDPEEKKSLSLITKSSSINKSSKTWTPALMNSKTTLKC